MPISESEKRIVSIAVNPHNSLNNSVRRIVLLILNLHFSKKNLAIWKVGEMRSYGSKKAPKASPYCDRSWRKSKRRSLKRQKVGKPMSDIVLRGSQPKLISTLNYFSGKSIPLFWQVFVRWCHLSSRAIRKQKQALIQTRKNSLKEDCWLKKNNILNMGQPCR